MSVHKQKQFNESSMPSQDSWAETFSINTRKAWILAYGLTFVALLALQFGTVATGLLIFGATFLQVTIAERSNCQADKSHPFAGALVSASLLYLSLLATSGFELLASVALTLVLYALLTVLESLVTAVMQTILAANGDARGKIAWLFDKKFAGFFGEVY